MVDMLESTIEVTTERSHIDPVDTAVLIVFTAPKVCPTKTNFSRRDSVYFVDLQSRRHIKVAQGSVVPHKGISLTSRLPMIKQICKFIVSASRDSALESTHTLSG